MGRLLIQEEVLNMEVTYISTDKAPAAIGPYSQGTKVGNMVFTSGQLGIDPKLVNLLILILKKKQDKV